MLPFLASRLDKPNSLKEAMVTLELAEKCCSEDVVYDASLRLYRVPLQCNVTLETVVNYWKAKGTSDAFCRSGNIRHSPLDTDDDRALFPLKENAMSGTKVNLFFRDVWKDAKQYHREAAAVLSNNACWFDGMYNDEATGWLIWFCAMYMADKEIAVSIMRLKTDYVLLGGLSDAVKQSGCFETTNGRMVCELRSLAGRGASNPDPDGDVKGRIDLETFKEKKSCLIGEEIRPWVKEVLRDEMLSAPTWSSKEDYWSRRWLYTKSGSHARRVEKEKLGGRLDLPSQPTRREFAEHVSECLVGWGEPMVMAGQSWKLEHYKTRAIYSGDTVSYYTFDYLLRPVEAVWANKRCLIDPGARSKVEMYQSLSVGGKIKLMLDLEDYNAQHEKDAMKVVIDEATKGAPEDVRKWAIDSIDNEIVFWNSNGVERSEKTVGGLFSGHRATSFLNTILNAAYIRKVAGQHYHAVEALHAGDDIIICGGTEAVGEILNACLDSTLRFNPSKQGLGRRAGEFLRVAFNEKEAGGYVARSIAGLVSGSWVTDREMSKIERAQNYANMAWTMCLRSRNDFLGLLMVSTFRRRLPEMSHLAEGILGLKLSLNGSPVKEKGRMTIGAAYVVAEVRRNKRKVANNLSFATDEFLEKHIDKEVLRKAGVSRNVIRRLMLEVSYKDREPQEEIETRLNVLVTSVPPREISDVGIALHTNRRTQTRTEPGAAKLLKRLKGDVDWVHMIAQLYGRSGPFGEELDKVRWPASNAGTLPISDLAKVSQQSVRPVYVSTTYPVRA
jgi:hypothetical protein